MTTDPQPARRARVADVLADADGWRWAPGFDKAQSPTYRHYLRQAEVVLAVLPEPADRAAMERVRAVLETEAVVGRSALEYRGLIASALMADEAQQPETQAHAPHHRWYVETYDYLADEWAPGQRFTDRAEAAARYAAVSETRPTWDDGTPVRRRFVRETTSFTVERPAAVSQPGKEA